MATGVIPLGDVASFLLEAYEKWEAVMNAFVSECLENSGNDF